MTAMVLSQLLRKSPATSAPTMSLGHLQRIGLWSYSIYLLHQPLLTICSYAADRIFPVRYSSDLSALFLLMVSWFLIIPFSILWYEVFELPGIMLGKRIIRNLETSKAAALPLSENMPVRDKRVTKLKYGWLVVAMLLGSIGCYMANAKFAPIDPSVNNNLAWSFATSPDPTKRNGAKAVELAEDACRQTEHEVTIMVGTLAAAYAEAGRFDKAIATAQEACTLAAKNGETNLLQKNQTFLSLYLHHMPYHEPPPNGGATH
jgi:hypothetical protein